MPAIDAVHDLLSPRDQKERRRIAEQTHQAVGRPHGPERRQAHTPRIDDCDQHQRPDGHARRDKRERTDAREALLVKHERRAPHRDEREQERPVDQRSMWLHATLLRTTLIMRGLRSSGLPANEAFRRYAHESERPCYS